MWRGEGHEFEQLFSIHVYNRRFLLLSEIRKYAIIARILDSKFCNYTNVETILFLGTEILDVPNLEKDNENERDRGTGSRSVG